ncbi:MAG: hypothetical protein RL336_395 [Pseudomonadota bacterium]|jgi:integrase
MAFILSMRYLTYQKGLPYYQRRFPKDVLEHPSITTTTYKRPLHVDPKDPELIARAIKCANEEFEDYVSTLRNANMDVLSDLLIERKARALLKCSGFDIGMAATDDMRLNEQVLDHAYHSNMFNEMSAYDETPDEIAHERPVFSETIRIQKRAWNLLSQKPDKRDGFVKTFAEVFENYWQKHMSPDSKNDRRDRDKIWPKFLYFGGGDTVVNHDTVADYLHDYVQKRSEEQVKTSTIERELSSIVAPLNKYIDSLPPRAKFAIKRPKLVKPSGESPDDKPPLLHVEQQHLIKIIQREKAQWKVLYLLISLHSGMHPMEASQLRREDFTFAKNEGELDFVELSGEHTQRKTIFRRRTVPLVFGVDIIKSLVESGEVEIMASKTADNIGVQISRVVKKINPKGSAYSMRHTLRHNAEAAGVEALVQMYLGGWSAKEMGLNAKAVNYSSQGKDVNERLLPRRFALEKMLAHLEL